MKNITTLALLLVLAAAGPAGCTDDLTSFGVDDEGQEDYPFYWSSTTHAHSLGGSSAAYVSSGRALGYMDWSWMDVHGAGAQRGDPKAGDPSEFPNGRGPRGDAIRIYNFVRVVRNVN